MPLTLKQILFLVLTIAALVVVFYLVRLLIQLQKTAREGERTLYEIRDLAVSLKELERTINARVDDVGDLLVSTKKMAAGLAQASLFLTTKVVHPAARFLPVVFPLLLMGLRGFKKKKEK